MRRDEFCTRLLSFRGPRYSAQTVTTCQGIYDLCLEVQPDYIVDIGTHYGTSALAMALAMVHLGRSVSRIVTLDRRRDQWATTLKTAVLPLYESGIDARRIRTVTGEFEDAWLLDRSGHVLLFYDIHDDFPASPSATLVEKWLPQVVSGTVVIHDCVVAAFEGQPVETIRHHSGLLLAGYPECTRVVNWLNEHGGAVHVSSAKAIYFEVRNGKPLS